ncbi:hypothetical protein [Hydrogenimonas sp.]
MWQSNLADRWFGFLKWLGMGMILLSFTSCTYMKMNPPPDTDKAFLNNNNSCYLATAANMLAGAGYGNGTTVQERAEDIYDNLTDHFGTQNTGWTDTALTWWLSSAHNTWSTNPYTVVTVYGNKTPRYPWANANGAKEIANHLRRCNFVGLSISWPTNAVDSHGNPIIGSGGHAITGWGDRSRLPWKGYSDPIASNPDVVRLTDSDTDSGGDVQQYDYDSYTSPNPGGANEGNGWYIDYSANHPYIKHIVTLSPTQTSGGAANIQRVIGSYRILQERGVGATDLHYRVGTDVDILSYVTWVSWQNEEAPDIEESQPRRLALNVDWDFTRKPVPEATWVTITTEFILRSWNAMKYENVRFTYPRGIPDLELPSISWEVKSARVKKADTIPDVTGGYLVAAFDIVKTTKPGWVQTVGKYRILHQYSYTQSPERHTLVLKGKKGYEITNLKVGHSYGYVDGKALWQFERWMSEKSGKLYRLSQKPVKIEIDWKGRLPYPKGEDIQNRIEDLKEGLMRKIPRKRK